MAKKQNSFSLSKNLKISEAQQLLILVVLIASIILGVGISLALNFVNQIAFNSKLIAERDQAIVAYSSAISTIGVCKKPKGSVYSEEELKKCNPSTIDINEIPGTLRYNIINGLAVNASLNSVSKSTVDTRCINPSTSKNYTVKELNQMYLSADDIDARETAGSLLKICSALRTIPDALPAYNNQEAFLSSVNMLFNLSGWVPEGLSPDNSGAYDQEVVGLGAYGIGVSVESDVKTAKTLLQNIERSIREIDVVGASIMLGGEESLKIELGARAYFVGKTELQEIEKTVELDTAKGGK